MSHYRHNLRDIEFNLFEVFGRGEVLGTGQYADVDEEVAREMLSHMAVLATEELGASLIESDRKPPVFDPKTHTVVTCDAFKKSYQAYLDSEFWRMDVVPSNGGNPVPPSLRWALAEMVLGSNPAVHMYSAGFAFSSILWHLGNEYQKELARVMVEQQWGCTMVLTEPDAGSDVGAGKTKAVQQADGTWHISGVKRFITSAESDMYPNVMHLVLARPEGAGPGTKGLSLFAVPKYFVDVETGEKGARNGVFVTNVEDKMGLKVSTTCEVRFGEVDNLPAVGTLVGDVHDGIAQMFKVIEAARMMVGTKAIATLSTGYLNALDYAKHRVQGPDLTRQTDKAAPRVTITHHPDVRRSLMTQKAYAEALRALVLYTATQQDAVQIAEAAGEKDDMAERVNDLLLPIVKGVGSERSWVLLGTESLQTFGGSGFLRDYPIEQYIRDAKIDSLYEGTTAIQGMDFFFRKIVRDKGQALQHIAKQIQEFVKADPGDGTLSAERELLGKALDDVQGILGYMVGQLMQSDPRTGGEITNLYKVGQNTSRLLMCAGDLICGWLLLRQAEIATQKLEASGASNAGGVSKAGGASKAGGVSEADKRFYEGKVSAARFFTRQVLPKITAERAIAEATDNALMEVDEASF